MISGALVAVIAVSSFIVPGAAHAAEGTVTVAGRVFDDANANGVFDEGEPVFPGAALQIMDATETPVPDPSDPSQPWTITTDAEGKYSWQVPPLPFAEYQYAVAMLSMPAGYQGNGGALLPDNSYWLGTTNDLTTVGAVDDAVDFALTVIPPERGAVVFGGAVWDDTDRDGIRDAGEPGFSGLTLRAVHSDGYTVEDPGNPGQFLEAVTEDDGSYRFDTLPYLDEGASYAAYLTNPPGGYLATSGQVADEYGGFTRNGNVPLTEEGATDLSLDFGFAKVSGVTVGGAVYVDANRSGTRDPFEQPLPDLTLSLRTPSETPVIGADGRQVTATTDATGAYRFSERAPLAAGESYVVVLDRAPDGYEPTVDLAPQGAGLQRPSTEDLTTPGASDTGIDFPLIHPDGGGTAGDWLVLGDIHADVLYPELDSTPGGGQALALRARVDGLDKPVEWNDLVIPQRDVLKETLPEVNTPDADYSFIAPPGATVWRNRQGGGAGSWIGMATQSPSLDGLPPRHPFVFRLDAVMGADGGAAPGDVVLWQDGPQNGALAPLLSTKQGLPSATAFGQGIHAHFNWSFTAPGVYCMAMSVSTVLPNGTPKEAHGFLTHVVGSNDDSSTVAPCGRTLTYPTPPVQQLTPSTDTTPAVWDDGRARIGVALRDGDLRVTLDRDAPRWQRPALSHKVDDVIVLSAPETIDGGVYRSEIVTGWDTLGIPADALKGQVQWTLEGARGPGQVSWMNIGEYANQGFDTATGTLKQHLSAGVTGNTRRASFLFTRPGVYCLDMSWSATTAAGAVVKDAHTLTMVVDGPLDPNGYDPLWKAHGKDSAFTGPVWRGAEHGALDKTCAQGATPTRADEVPVPGGGTDPGPEPEAPVWDVPNWSRTDSGAVILNDGHLDVASTLDGGVFDTQVKDTTVEGVANATRYGASWHDPAEVVMQLLPGSETVVPAEEKYRFLGAAGAPVWLVTETQQEGLVWPGWSTESIPLTATTTGVDWRLDRVSGPGEFSLSKGGSSLGSVDVLMNTRDGITAADKITIPKHSHVHGDWAFSAEGTYCLGFTRSTTLPDGSTPTDTFTLAVAVGKVSVKKIDPATCFTDNGQPSTPDTTAVPESQLTDATSGGVQVLGDTQGFLAGQLVTVKTGAAPLGSWVSVWVHSTGAAPVWTGWALVNAAGTAQLRLPADLPEGSHKLVIKKASGELVGWDVFTVVAPPATTPPSPGGGRGDGGAVPAAATQCTPTNVAVIGAGHLDWNAQLVGGKLESLIGDDSTGTRVYRDPASTVLWLKPASKQTLPTGYGQVGPAGTIIWQNPQTQNPDLIWLGWSTELLNAGNASSSVNWSLDSVDGPGTVKVYTASSFGGVQQVYFDGPGSFRIPLGVHAHANWAFSAEGIYRLRFTQTVTLPGGQASSDTETLTIAVGDVNPTTAISTGNGCGVISNAIRTGTAELTDAAKAAQQAQAEAARVAAATVTDGRDTTDGDSPAALSPFAALEAGNPVPLLLSILGALLIVGAVGTGVLWWRRRRGDLPL
ncbi:TIGR03773 family transporter-associated surface protein [uncultured Microbacterium sp.]|uniref:TIGR03773 family transporter-associated surface protein n=1 Tax=uncultured Microbacterium sp. TaxID=191216 RepID=UPI0028D7F254|nr:TIGR03773 family transporter-associated surface protein [uncultured Microbacterium sp.]